MTAFILKLIAIITMLFDHTSFLIYNGASFSWMRCVGRIAFPIFAFQISEGYVHTKNIKKYYIRLFIFALLSEIPFAWFYYIYIGDFSVDVIFTLLFGLLSINLYDMFTNYSKNNAKSIQILYKFVSFTFIGIIAFLAEKLSFDYGYYGVLLILLFYIFRDKKILMNIFAIILTFIYYMPRFIKYNFHKYYIILFFCTLIPLIFINLYNNKQGKKIKWLFYVFYPLHLLIICIIQQFII